MRRGESSTSSNILFSLLIFLLITEAQARKSRQSCSTSCGDLKNISYPFRLKGDPKKCGVRELELSCQSNKAILQFHSGKYYVEEINDIGRREFYIDRKMIRVVDVNLARGNCSLPTQSLPTSETLYNDKRTGQNLKIRKQSKSLFGYPYYIEAKFLNCSSNFSHPAYIRFPCLGGNQSQFYLNYDSESISDPPESCSLVSSIPIIEGIERYPPYENVKKFLKSGFFLEWSGTDCSRLGVPQLIEYPICFYYSKNYLLFLLEYATSIFCEIIMSGIMVNHISIVLPVVLICRFVLPPIVLLAYITQKYRKTWKVVDNVEKFLYNQQSWMPKRYSYCEIIAMTNHFRDKLGKGGFGSVYKGQRHDGCLIAVKVLEDSKFSAEEFINEVSTIGRIHHVNIVQLLGFCSEGSKRALVYEYMPNGSLDRHIFSKGGKGQSFSLEKLHEIALGTARGIEYLHGGCDVCILHFDIKPHNILLDSNFIPKVSDFGLAKFYPKENDSVSISCTRGTIGYIAPELISRNFGVVSCKSDVYSFGMLLLEMAGGRRNSFSMETRSSKAYFPSWVYDQIQEGKDLELQNVNEVGIARKMCIIGLWCIQLNAADRPSITKVREMLEGSIDDLQMPPNKPCFSSSHHIPAKYDIDSNSSSIELLATESMGESL